MGRKFEIDEEELVRHQNLAKTVSTLMANPKARVMVEEAVKVQWPDAKTPALDEMKSKQELTSGIEKKFDDFIAKQEAEKAENDKNTRLGALMKQRSDGLALLKKQGWRDTGIKAVEALMDEKGILDPLDAAAIYEKNHPPEQPMTPGSSGAWNFLEGSAAEDGSEADIKKLIESKGQNDHLADTMARKALHEFRQEFNSR